MKYMRITFIPTHIHVVANKELCNTCSDPEEEKKTHNMKKYSEKCLRNLFSWNPWKYLNLLKIREVDFMIKKDIEIIDMVYLKTSIFLRYFV